METICETSIRRVFYKVGLVVGRFPWVFLALTLVVSATSAFGLLRFKKQDSARDDFCPDDSPSKYEFAVVRDFFGVKHSPYYLGMVVEAKDGGSVLRREHLREIIHWDTYLFSHLTSTTEGKTTAFKDLCGAHCAADDPLRYFLVSYNEGHYGASANESSSSGQSVRLTYPVMDLIGESLYLGANLLNVTTDSLSHEIRAVSFVLFNYRAQIDSPLMKRQLRVWEEELALAAERVSTNTSGHLILTAASEGLITNEINRIGHSTLPYVGLSVVIILAFTIGTTLTGVSATSHPWAAVCGVLTPLLAIVTAFGLLLALGARYMSVVTVVPFLVLAVGVDDVYLTLHAWRRTSNALPVAERLAQTLEHVGPSITITSLTNAISFYVGITASTPAVRTFCLFAAVAVTVAYIYQLTYFSVVLVMDHNRQAAGHSGYVLCLANAARPDVAATERETAKPSSFAVLCNKMSTTLDRFNCRLLEILSQLYTSNIMRVLTAAFIVVYLSVSINGVLKMKVELSPEKLLLPDTPLGRWPRLERYINQESGHVLLFVNNPGNLTDTTRLEHLMEFVNRFQQHNNSIGTHSTNFWLWDYLNFASLNSRGHGFQAPATTQFTYKKLTPFLSMQNYKKWRLYMNLGDKESCEADNPKCIRSFALSTGFSGVGSWPQRSWLIGEWRSLARNYSDLNCTVFIEWSMYADQVSSLGQATTKTILIAIVCMTVVCVLFIPNPGGVVCATLSVVSINLGVIGLLSWWSVDLDPLSMTTILMSIGFSVDFTAHMSYHYYRGDHETTKARVLHALSAIGRPSVQAAMSTLLATVVLLIVPAYMQIVFVKTVVLVVALGLMHGLWLLPVLLTTLTELLAICRRRRTTDVLPESSRSSSSAGSSKATSTTPWKRHCKVEPLRRTNVTKV